MKCLLIYYFNHLIKWLWKELTEFTFFNVAGRLFHTIGPEYIKLCLDISFFGLGGMKLEEIVDLKSGIFSSKILWL